MGQKVFISYSQQPPDEAKFAEELHDRLIRAGFTTFFDKRNKSTSVPWPQKILDGLRDADFVLLICTESYRKKFNYEVPDGEGKGVKWEGSYITQDLYNKECRTNRFIPVYFHPDDSKYIPDILSGFERFDLSENQGYDRLLNYLSQDLTKSSKPSPLQASQTREGISKDSPPPSSTQLLSSKILQECIMKITIGILRAENVEFINRAGDGLGGKQEIDIGTIESKMTIFINNPKGKG